MHNDMEMEIQPEDVVPFLGHLKAERDDQAGILEPGDSDNIRKEHMDRVEAADRLLGSIESHRPGQMLVLKASEAPGRFILTMATDRMLQQVADDVGRVWRYDMEDYDAIEAAADRAVRWTRIARQVNLHDDHATVAERLLITEGAS
jgi:hypothetical protein